MLDCWQVSAQRRPTFPELSQHLSKLISDEKVGSYFCSPGHFQIKFRRHVANRETMFSVPAFLDNTCVYLHELSTRSNGMTVDVTGYKIQVFSNQTDHTSRNKKKLLHKMVQTEKFNLGNAKKPSKNKVGSGLIKPD